MKTNLIEGTIATLVVALTGAAITPAVHAQSSASTTPIRMIVGVPPGGSLDASARIVAERIQMISKRTVVVENKPGANQIIATKLVEAASPDLNMLLVASQGPMTTNPYFHPQEQLDPIRNLTPLTAYAVAQLVLVVHPSLPMKTAQELIAYAKSKPGELSYSFGTTSFRIATEMLAQQAQIELNPVPYNGAAPAMNAVAGGHVNMSVLDIATALPLINGGRVRPVLTLSPQRSSRLPEVPSTTDVGLSGLDAASWAAFFSSPGLPDGKAAQLQALLGEALRHPEVQERLSKLGYDESPLGDKALVEMIERDTAAALKVIKQARIIAN